jgi:hypothetical protein
VKSYTLANGTTRFFTDPLRVLQADLAQGLPPSLRHTISDLRQLKTDAVVLKKFLQAEEIATLLHRLQTTAKLDFSTLSQSMTYPFSFATLYRQSPAFAAELYSYFEQCHTFAQNAPALLGVDLQQKFTTLLTELNDGQAAQVLQLDPTAAYLPFTVRLIVPQKNHINLHADNLFHHLAPEFYAPLKQVAEVHNQLSFFVVLQQPEQGGELSLFNAVHDVAKDFNIEQQTILLDNGESLHAQNPEEVFRQQLNLEAGDLVVFAGGQLYHRIEEVYGAQLRITLGGFLGYAQSGGGVYYWS